MRIEWLGVGEAFDAEQPNSSVLIEYEGFCLQIDCGHSVVPRLWRARTDPDAVDAVYFTHHHADHVLGLPSLVNRWHYEGRRKALQIVTTPAGIAQVQALIALMDVEPPYALHYKVAEEIKHIGPFAIAIAPTQHPTPNFAIRLQAGGHRMAYSGDGRPTPESLALYVESDLLLHECFEPEPVPENPYHCDLPTARAIVGPGRIGLYHIRAGQRGAMRQKVAGDPRLFVPEAGQALNL